ncbi:zinc metalloproteinase nas-12 [Caerostris extrusa]|uniref:Metalloendopeptidase n=1 Tax=Caerostris extrusa TaxID=172846 RepID=A0AAV4Y9E8_CAEEX|nr:zinc metalloproteinase nas-12 [Caerostris extrusa]
MKINEVFFFYFILSGITFSVFFASGNELLPGKLIDGDIMIDGHEDPWDRRHGPLVDMREKRWPGGVIPYEFNETIYNDWDQHVINEGLQEIERGTCIKFIKRTNEKDYIYITPLGGCWSYVGRKGSGQTMSLPGRLHRNFVGKCYERRKANKFRQTSPGSTQLPEIPYDYQSVMHYDAYAFSKSPKLPTMKPKTPNVRLRDLGRAKAVGILTDTDRQKINSLYECN